MSCSYKKQLQQKQMLVAKPDLMSVYINMKLHPNAPQLLVSCVHHHFLMPLMQDVVWKIHGNPSENVNYVLDMALECCECMLNGLKSCSTLLTHLRSTRPEDVPFILVFIS